MHPLTRPDRQPSDGAPVPANTSGSRPLTEAETALLAIWQAVLGTPTLSIHDNFFDAGGHSLLVVGLVARIRAELNVDLSLRDLIAHQTVAELAVCVAAESSRTMRERRTASPWTHLIDLTAGGGIPVFFLPGGVGGDDEFLVYARLVRFVDAKYRFYGFRPQSADGLQGVERMAAIVTDCLAEIRRVQPAGPYRIVGNCIGGMLAIEVARQLRESGDTVGALVLMDSAAPMSPMALRRLSRPGMLRKKWERFGYFRRRWTHHRDRMRAMTWSDQMRYSIDRVVAVTASRQADAQRQTYVVNRQTYMDALRQHRPTVYRDPVQFIVSRGLASKNVPQRWSHLLRGRVDVIEAPGDHHEYIRTHAEATAKILEACLDRSA